MARPVSVGAGCDRFGRFVTWPGGLSLTLMASTAHATFMVSPSLEVHEMDFWMSGVVTRWSLSNPGNSGGIRPGYDKVAGQLGGLGLAATGQGVVESR